MFKLSFRLVDTGATVIIYVNLFYVKLQDIAENQVLGGQNQ